MDQKIECSIRTLDQWLSPEFMRIRSDAWHVVLDYWFKSHNSRNSIVEYLLDGTVSLGNPYLPPWNPTETITSPLHSLVIVLNYWHRLYVLHTQQLIDWDLLEPVVYDFRQWSPFLDELCRQCKHGAYAGRAQYPGWINAIEQLGALISTTSP